MIRKLVQEKYNAETDYIEISCLSTDTKPVGGIVTGSLAMEVDTGDIYAYNEEGTSGSEWCKIASLGGGS